MNDEKEILKWAVNNNMISQDDANNASTLLIDTLASIYDLRHGKLEFLHQKEDGTPWIGYLHESYEEAMERQRNEDVLDQPAELSPIEIYINEHPEDFIKK